MTIRYLLTYNHKDYAKCELYIILNNFDIISDNYSVDTASVKSFIFKFDIRKENILNFVTNSLSMQKKKGTN